MQTAFLERAFHKELLQIKRHLKLEYTCNGFRERLYLLHLFTLKVFVNGFFKQSKPTCEMRHKFKLKLTCLGQDRPEKGESYSTET